MPRVADIKEAVAAHYGITVAELTGLSRVRPLAHKRQLAMALSVELTRHGQSRVAFFFARDHSTVAHARAQIRLREQNNPNLREDMASLRRKLSTGGGD